MHFQHGEIFHSYKNTHQCQLYTERTTMDLIQFLEVHLSNSPYRRHFIFKFYNQDTINHCQLSLSFPRKPFKKPFISVQRLKSSTILVYEVSVLQVCQINGYKNSCGGFVGYTYRHLVGHGRKSHFYSLIYLITCVINY